MNPASSSHNVDNNPPAPQTVSSTSPSDTTSPGTLSSKGRLLDAEDLARKRARDRKSQRAMRERAKWSMQCLTDQVTALTQALQNETREKEDLMSRFLAVSEELDHLRVQKAALQLRLLGNGTSTSKPESPVGTSPAALAPHEAIPLNTAPTTMSDQILQTFAEARWEAYTSPSQARVEAYPEKPDLSALFDGRPNRIIDETSGVVGDIVRSYKEIDTLPKQVAVHYVMSTLMKWQVLRNKASYDQMPEWLRPLECQMQVAHPSWMDRIPWPNVRQYLIECPGIAFDDFAGAYSTSFFIRWDYDPNHVIITTSAAEGGGILINPIYEEHIRQLKNWTVGDVFRRRFPELSTLVDVYSQSEQ
ncbi:hypothetical protein BU16DRAFT_534024 [Lophium mytilinum]|uniref:BZIP domain-containing protein n=1 Tax=Lophium mytilinum TaxID=390894 RepID=A0A6A6R9A9_9PEZI|nr:hypothetical protein BU16DRAFT_534024 [Lophium mytilinum]